MKFNDYKPEKFWRYIDNWHTQETYCNICGKRAKYIMLQYTDGEYCEEYLNFDETHMKLDSDVIRYLPYCEECARSNEENPLNDEPSFKFSHRVDVDNFHLDTHGCLWATVETDSMYYAEYSPPHRFSIYYDPQMEGVDWMHFESCLPKSLQMHDYYIYTVCVCKISNVYNGLVKPLLRKYTREINDVIKDMSCKDISLYV